MNMQNDGVQNLHAIETAIFETLAHESQAQIPVAAMKPEMHLKADLAIDSLTFIRCIVALEDKLNVTFGDALLMQASFETVAELIAYIRDECAGSGTP